MNEIKQKFSVGLRVARAIAAKDIIDALKNKTTLTIVITVLFMMAFYRLLPSLEEENELPNVLVYDAGDSTLVQALAKSPWLNLYTYDSEEHMLKVLREGEIAPELGLVIPAGFERAFQAGKEAQIEGYVLHWVSQAQVQALTTRVEDEAQALTGQRVRVAMIDAQLYPRQEATGYPFLASLSFIFATTMFGVTLVPHLMLEEKKSRTLDALLVSPAGAGQIVLGKALAGLFYCLVGVGISFLFNTAFIHRWEVALLAGLCGSLFSVSLGLLLGNGIENQGQLMLWGWVLLTPLLIPVFISVMEDLVPANVYNAIQWLPTVTLSRLFRRAFAEEFSLAGLGPELSLLLGSTALILALVVWLVRRSDR